MKNITLIILLFLLSSCSNIVSKSELKEIIKEQQTLTGYSSNYLGSDSQFHYIQVFNAVSTSTYRVKVAELSIAKPYEYKEEDPGFAKLSDVAKINH